ncbi:glycosyltransferase family 4 protein [Frigoribacterium sp. CFBP 13712]|uniref:glycosyltransferase family 4 protein n=1 Tax=Frigoribacterium sp. CFBP 13712 TaxID=2775309 RepID=UPI00177EEC37|nr:glycosyltransferase family 4 protein [Frigoribacterium sp. CFBP 13712]MBD8703979.1 glycosyltransferase family 4 protein [Frigoribacterium sp. CFBP 13712]
MTDRHADPGALMVIPEARSAHLERLRERPADKMLYLASKPDFDADLATGQANKVTLLSACWRVALTRSLVLEMPEPLWLRFFPKFALLGLIYKATNPLRRGRGRVVVYAIENNGLDQLLSPDASRGKRVVGPALRMAIRTISNLVLDRICFGSPGSEATYAQLRLTPRLDKTTILELPAAADETTTGADQAVLFVGALEERKGVRQLMEAWEGVERLCSDAHLTIVGDGPLRAAVEAWQGVRPQTRRYEGQLDRRELDIVYRRHSVLAAPSIREGRWREQIGLPIKEGLARGLHVVTTSETGLAPWLSQHGHGVLQGSQEPDMQLRLMSSILNALSITRDPRLITSDLPRLDGRTAAREWLHYV